MDYHIIKHFKYCLRMEVDLEQVQRFFPISNPNSIGTLRDTFQLSGHCFSIYNFLGIPNLFQFRSFKIISFPPLALI